MAWTAPGRLAGFLGICPKNEHPKRSEMEAPGPCEDCAQNQHSITSAIFFCSKHTWGLHGFSRWVDSLHFLMGMRPGHIVDKHVGWEMPLCLSFKIHELTQTQR